ncbi:MAG: exodeoxyribonuclease III [Candidatus Cloacimonetes bacterium]|nr:exodeoxyribonuclease III [Candidatus Cloacimonadota bacterium]MDD2650021.1 exodeoxyribonuclease III [Candidatus Cloacimonadota bacterium]MDD3501028.1 exodeoxyribonuclease III [Candidatus Cloacimonadota bacterium]
MDIKRIYDVLGEHFKSVTTPIIDLVKAQTEDPFKILVGTILSARTKDEVTAEVVSRLFSKVDNADELGLLSEEEIQKLIYPVGFFRNKAKYLKALPEVLNTMFEGKIPDEIDDLVKLPGVGRKTANLVRALAFEKPAMCVDIHVHRISNRLGYIKTKTPLQSEMALRDKLPIELWINYNSYLVAFGQSLCKPINPRCDICPIYDECKRVDVKTKFERTHYDDQKMENTMKIISWNINGLRAIIKKNFFDFIEDFNPDVLGIQETKLQEEQIPKEVSALGSDYHIYYDFAERKGYSGTALFTKQKPISFSNSIDNEYFENEGRINCVEYDKFYLFNVYFPNGGMGDDRLQYKLEFYEQFLVHIENLRKTGKHIVVMGDYNTAHKEIDLARPKDNEKVSGFLPIERAWLDKLVEHGYVDTFRHFHDEPEQYTWWSYKTRARERNVGWRIDYVFVNKEFLPFIKDAFIMPDIEGSDHCPVGVEIII